MAQQITVSPRFNLQRLLPLIIATLLIAAGCDDKKSEPEAEQPVPSPTLEGDLARTEATGVVRDGLRSAYSAAIRAEKRAENAPRTEDREFAEEGRRVSIIYSANNRGEREDCGCKSNPLGGLARRHTLIDLARSGGEDAARWWGEPSAPMSSLFVVDAGDLFYKSANVDRMSSHDKRIAKIDARTVAKAIALAPPDAYVASELDLTLGLDDLQELLEIGKVPAVSANLEKGGELVFPAYRVVERDGLQVAFVGITKPDPRLPDFWESRGLSVRPFAESYQAAVNELPSDVDLVVLLSNAGVPDTESAIKVLAEKEVRVDAAFVSNSNRLLKRPSWAAGVPIVEPLSRGKWLGRVDLVLRGDDVAFIDERSTPDDLIRRYRRAQGAWLNAESRRIDEEKRLISAKIEVRDRGDEASPDDAVDEQAAARGKGKGGKPNVDFLEKRVVTMGRQAQIARDTLMQVVSEMRAVEEADSGPSGDDEFIVRARQVALDIPQEPNVRRLIEAAEKTKPAEPKPTGRKVNVPPRPRGHDH